MTSESPRAITPPPRRKRGWRWKYLAIGATGGLFAALAYHGARVQGWLPPLVLGQSAAFHATDIGYPSSGPGESRVLRDRVLSYAALPVSTGTREADSPWLSGGSFHGGCPLDPSPWARRVCVLGNFGRDSHGRK